MIRSGLLGAPVHPLCAYSDSQLTSHACAAGLHSFSYADLPETQSRQLQSLPETRSRRLQSLRASALQVKMTALLKRTGNQLTRHLTSGCPTSEVRPPSTSTCMHACRGVCTAVYRQKRLCPAGHVSRPQQVGRFTGTGLPFCILLVAPASAWATAAVAARQSEVRQLSFTATMVHADLDVYY